MPITALLLTLDGIVGFFFHIRGVQRKPGGWRIPIFNIVMGPPIFAPPLLAICGFLGVIASLLRREDAPDYPTLPGIARLHPAQPTWQQWLPRGLIKEEHVVAQDVREGRFQRALAIAAAMSAFFSGVESLYSHYKNDFAYRVQWTPIIMTPLLMFAGFGAVWSRTIARTLLPIASVLAMINGGVGFFFHARGVLRRPAGLKAPLYNIMYGPPVFAPLLFAASGFLGTLASLLRRAD
jgi:hypothetical protein